MKSALLEALPRQGRDLTRRMRAMRKTVIQHDVAAWADSFLEELSPALARQGGPPRQAHLMLTISTDPSLSTCPCTVAVDGRVLGAGPPREVVERSVASRSTWGRTTTGSRSATPASSPTGDVRLALRRVRRPGAAGCRDRQEADLPVLAELSPLKLHR